MPISSEGIPVPEFSRRVEVAHITATPAQFPIEADEHERAALAPRLGLVSLDRFSAIVTLRRVPGRLYELSAALAARVTQTCVVTLDPFEAEIIDEFTLLYGAPEDAEKMIDDEADDIEPLIDGVIDIGEAVAQQLSLALDPHPRGPGAAAAGEH